MEKILTHIRSVLKKNADEKTKLSSQKFFKEQIKSYGVKSATVEKIGKEYFREIKDLNKKELFNLCDQLWQSGFIEESFIACHWSFYLHKRYEPSDFKIFRKWIDCYVNNWASCDTLCNHTMGEFIEMYPEFLSELKKWTKSDNRWMRRASAVSLIIPARHGKFLSEIISIADLLLLDKDDLVQKGYGWMLKVAGDKHPQEIFNYVMQNKAIMPRTALRYAIEKMPQAFKEKAMKKE